MIDPVLIAAAKAEIEKCKLSDEDKKLQAKYPRHTLEDARIIDATPLCTGVPGNRNAFDLIRLQETANFHINTDHT